ncbi:MAG: hypothetical protein K0Q59_1356 [Paenibacillus sp.]|jgi:hypothetical protein|nr:hypothetical protein [Paenibacillus sp.]
MSTLCLHSSVYSFSVGLSVQPFALQLLAAHLIGVIG